MGLKENLFADMQTAMRDKAATRLETIRLLRAAIQRREVDDQVELDDDGVLQIVQKMVKQCQDAAAQFSKGSREDLADKEKASIAILETYLPEPLSDQEVDILIQQAMQQTGAASMKDMGKVVGMIKARSRGRADMAKVSARIKSLLS